MNESRTAGIVGVVLSAVFVLGIMYLALAERLGINSAGPNVRLPVVATAGLPRCCSFETRSSAGFSAVAAASTFCSASA